jgi:hypothetical protein
VRRVSRSSLATSLQQTADAVRASATTSRSSENPRRDRGAGAAVKSGLNPAIIHTEEPSSPLGLAECPGGVDGHVGVESLAHG